MERKQLAAPLELYRKHRRLSYVSERFNGHATAEQLEEYSFGRLGENQLERIEEHLLVCQRCQEELEALDSFRSNLRAAMESPAREIPVQASRRQPRWGSGAFSTPWAAAAMLGVLTLGVGVAWQQVSGPDRTVVLELDAQRGVETSALDRDATVEMRLANSGIADGEAATIEVIDATGAILSSQEASWQADKLVVTAERGLSERARYLRVRDSQGRLVREYMLPQ